MSAAAFALIVASALLHALWNLLVKRSRHKTVFIWWMFLASFAPFCLIEAVAPVPLTAPPLHSVAMAAVGAVCFAAYHLLNGRAYHAGGDLSLVYPLSQTSLLYVPLWAALLLGERLSLPGALGILLVLCGSYTIQLQRLSLDELLRPLRKLRDPSVRAALSAGFIYSIGSVAEKSGVRGWSPLHFTFLLVAFMVALMSVNLLRPKYRPLVLQEAREHPWMILAAGPIVLGSFLTFRYGLNLAPVSYAVPVRQVSVVFGVLIGLLFLREPFGRMRLGAALFILSGAALIRLG